MSDKPRVGVSSCLLGQPVRYDGKTKRVDWIADVLSQRVELIPICPELGAGMGVPRPPIQVVRVGAGLRLRLVDQDTDVSEPFMRYVEAELLRLQAQGIDGFLLKARSPSCGLRGTPHYDGQAAQIGTGAGLWALALREKFPGLVLANEEDVSDVAGQERFLASVRAHALASKAP